MTVPTWLVWASGDCEKNAKALLAAEKNLGKLFGELRLSSLMAKREFECVGMGDFAFNHRFFTPQGQQLDFMAKENGPAHLLDDRKIVIRDHNDKEVVNFDFPSPLEQSDKKQINVSAQDTPLGTIRWRSMAFGNDESKMFELYSAQGGHMIGKIHVPHKNSQIFPLFDPHANRVGKIFNDKKE